MRYLHKLFKKMLGSDGENAEILEAKTIEAEDIKSGMTKDITKIQKKVDTLNVNTYNKLQEISGDLASVTYKIAVASGGKKRGLK